MRVRVCRRAGVQCVQVCIVHVSICRLKLIHLMASSKTWGKPTWVRELHLDTMEETDRSEEKTKREQTRERGEREKTEASSGGNMRS